MAEPMSVVVLEPAVVLQLEPLEVLGQTATPEGRDLMRRSLLGIGLLVKFSLYSVIFNVLYTDGFAYDSTNKD